MRKFFIHLAIYRLRRPCCWSIPWQLEQGGQQAAAALPTDLAAHLERRQQRLAELATSYDPAQPGRPSPLAFFDEPGEVEALKTARRAPSARSLAALDEEVPAHLHVYAAAAHRVMSELDEAQRSLEAEIKASLRQPERSRRPVSLSEGRRTSFFEERRPSVPDSHANGHSALTVPSLRWDTSVLDVEEDRVIWVRESDLGKISPLEKHGSFGRADATSTLVASSRESDHVL